MTTAASLLRSVHSGFIAIAALVACTENRAGPARADTAAADSLAAAATPVAQWRVERLSVAPPRFRPGGWSSEDVLWGLVRGRLTRLDTRTGATTTLQHDAWSIHAASGVVGWRNERGTWIMREGGEPVRLADQIDAMTEFDGPPTLLWSPDGTRALLGWHGEWDAAYDLVERDGTKRRLAISLPGYFGNDAALWLDSNRVLFHTVAKGPVGGEPEYRESGWRGALALLDLRAGTYKLVVSVPDFTRLRVAGLHPEGVLVTEFHGDTTSGQWYYDPATWQRRPASLPKGRAFASRGGAVLVLLDTSADSTAAILAAVGPTRAIGRVPRDAEPAFSPSGRRGALRTDGGVMVFEPEP